MRSRFNFQSWWLIFLCSFILYPKNTQNKKKYFYLNEISFLKSYFSFSLSSIPLQNDMIDINYGCMYLGGNWFLPYKYSPVARSPFNCKIRVLLSELSFDQEQQWHIATDNEFLFSHMHAKKQWRFKKNTFELKLDKDQLFVDGKLLPLSYLTIGTTDGHITFNDNTYAGSLLFCKDNAQWYVINQVDIEDYICSVLRSESWPGWPVEVNKAFAVASRSYVMARMRDAKQSQRFYHIKDTNIHQTYRGVHDRKEIIQAVEETKGIILTYNNEPIDAMFDSCCGGLTPAHVVGFDFGKAPYLARPYPCTFCSSCMIYSWFHDYEVHEVEKMLQDFGLNIQGLKYIKVTKIDNAGTVQEVLVKDRTKKPIFLSGKQCYAIFKMIKSFCFTIERKGKKILFSGKGYGHHIGLCQWGARRMIDEGYTCWEILRFFYPGVAFRRLASLV